MKILKIQQLQVFVCSGTTTKFCRKCLYVFVVDTKQMGISGLPFVHDVILHRLVSVWIRHGVSTCQTTAAS